MPLVSSRLIHKYPGRVGLRTVLQVVVEERLHGCPAEPGGCVAFEHDRPDAAALATALTVIPGSEDEVNPLAVRIAAGQRLVQRRAAVDVFLIKQARDNEHGNG